MAHNKWWEVKPANAPPTIKPISADLATLEDARRQVIEEQEVKAQEGKGSFFSGLGKAALSPLKAAGKQTLEWLEDYERRFVAPTAVWAIGNLAELNANIGTINPANIFQEGAVFNRGKTLFGRDFSDLPDINPLAAYNGDDEEIEKAYNYFTNELSLGEQLTYGLVFDPTSWIGVGVGGAAKLMTKGGLKLLGQSGKMAQSLESLTSARTVASKLRTTGGRSLIGIDGELDNLIAGLNKSRSKVGQAAIGLEQEQAARAMIGAASLMNFMVGTPEIMLDNFLRSAVRPLGKVPFIPRLALEEIDGAPRLKVQLVGVGPRSARSELDMAFRDTSHLVDAVKMRAEAELGVDLATDYREVDRKIIEILQRTDLEFPSPHATAAYRSIHDTDLVDLNKFATQVDDNRPLDWVLRDLGEDIMNARVSEFGIGTKEMVEKLEGFRIGWDKGFKWDINSRGMSRVVANLAGLPEGRRFFRNKIAATWMWGVLYSPFYIIQQPMTNMMNSGMKTALSPKLNRLTYGEGSDAVINAMVDRADLRIRLGLTSDPVKDALKAEDVFSATEYGTLSMMLDNQQKSGGLVVEVFDKGAEAVRKLPGGSVIADGMRAGTRMPRALAQGNDDNAFRAVYEHMMGNEITRRIATHPDPEVAAIFHESQNIYKDLRQAGVGQAEAKAVSMRYITATSPDDFSSTIRDISKMSFADKMGLINQNGKSMRPDWLQSAIHENAVASGGGGRRFTKGQDRIFRLEYPRQLKQFSEDTREWMRAGPQAHIDAEGNPSFTLHHNSQMDILDDIEDDIFPRMIFPEPEKPPTTSAELRKVKTPRGNDVKLWGDVAIRQNGAKTAHNTLMAHVVESYKEDPVPFMRKWNGSEASRNARTQQFGVQQKSFLNDVNEVRWEFIKSGGQERKEWGNFRIKWGAQADLVADPNMDAIANFVRKRQNDDLRGYFAKHYDELGIHGEDVNLVVTHSQGIFDDIALSSRQALRDLDGAGARTNAVVRAGQRAIDNSPKRWNPNTAQEAGRILEESSAKSADYATERMGDFWSGNTNLDEMLSWWVPFSRFGTRAMSMSLRSAARYPPLAPAFYRWSHASEKEQSPIPGWIPLSGDVWANPLGATAAFQLFEAFTGSRKVFGGNDLERLQSSLGLIGLAPGPPTIAAARLFTDTELQGSLFPAQRFTTQPIAHGVDLEGTSDLPFIPGGIPNKFNPFLQIADHLSAIPGAAVPERILESISSAIYGEGSEPQIDRETQQVLADKGFDPQAVAKDSDEYKKARSEAITMRMTNFLGAGLTLREIPEERIQYAQKVTNILAKEGIPQEMQLRMRRKGDSPWNRLNSEQVDSVIQQIGEDEFTNRTNVTPFGLNREERQVWRSINAYFAISHTEASTMDNDIAAAGQDLFNGVISGKEYRDRRSQAFDNFFAILDAQKRSALALVVGNDVFDREEWPRELVNQEFVRMQTKLKVSRGGKIDEILLPEDVALDIYRNISPDTFENPITGEVDWDAWADTREFFIQLQEPGIQKFIERANNRREERDPVEATFTAAKELMDIYQSIPQFLGLDDEESDLATQGLAFVSAAQDVGATREQAFFMLAQEDPTTAIMARIALKTRNPERQRYWEENPILSLFFGNDVLLDEAISFGLPGRSGIIEDFNNGV